MTIHLTCAYVSINNYRVHVYVFYSSKSKGEELKMYDDQYNRI